MQKMVGGDAEDLSTLKCASARSAQIIPVNLGDSGISALALNAEIAVSLNARSNVIMSGRRVVLAIVAIKGAKTGTDCDAGAHLIIWKVEGHALSFEPSLTF